MNTHDLIAAIGHVANHYACPARCVSIRFEYDNDPGERPGGLWTITVTTPARDRRRRRGDSSSGWGPTLAEAVEHVIRRSDLHTPEQVDAAMRALRAKEAP